VIPIKDENPTETFPFVTVSLIIINILVFIWELKLDPYTLNAVIDEFGAVPAKLWGISKGLIPPFISLITCMFLHGGFLHIGGNMLYLWIFGNNVEDRLGHIRFLFFYVICGIIATLFHSVVYPNSSVPLIGASGAISGVLGAYLIEFPFARIVTLVFIFIFITTIRLPAFLFIGFWFFMQYLNGIASLALYTPTGVAWFAHIGGFVSGLILYRFFPKRKSRRKVYYYID
jgi:membrane associated rhomboid family serine protease